MGLHVFKINQSTNCSITGGKLLTIQKDRSKYQPNYFIRKKKRGGRQQKKNNKKKQM